MKYHKIISIKETFTHTLVLLLVAGYILDVNFDTEIWVIDIHSQREHIFFIQISVSNSC